MKKIILSILFFTSISLICTAQTFELVKDINPEEEGHSAPKHFIIYNDLLYFAASDGTHKEELWVTDGTEEGTHMVKDINPGVSPSYPNQFTISNGKLYFSAGKNGHGMEVWVTDGTEEGTNMVKDINPSMTILIGGGGINSPYDLTAFNDKLYFNADDGEHGRELWVTNGTEASTHMLIDIMPDEYNLPDNGSNPTRLTVTNNRLYFTAKDSLVSHRLWVTNGLPSETFRVTEAVMFSGSHKSMIVYDNILYFRGLGETTGEELWRSDGTDSGTFLVKDINPGSESSDLENFIILNDKLFFTASNAENGRELWITYGTHESTIMVKDINPGTIGGPWSSDIFDPIQMRAYGVYNDRLYFMARDGVHGYELWVTDGTEEGTYMLKDINQNGDGGSTPLWLTVLNDKLYFIADDGWGHHLWVTDGTEEGTQKVTPSFGSAHDSPLYPSEIGSSEFSELHVYNGSLYFAAYYDDHGYELWKYTPDDEVNVNKIESEKEIQFFPNPVSDIITIESPHSIQKAALYTVSGKLLKVWRNPSNKIDFSSYSSGVYLLEVSTSEETVVSKVVKE